jgi:hypothetical protein
VKRSTTRPGALATRARAIYDVTTTRKAIYASDKVYYKVQFTGEIGLPPINAALDMLRGETAQVVKIFPDKKSLKIAMKQSDLEGFILRLHKVWKLVDNVSSRPYRISRRENSSRSSWRNHPDG